MANAKQWDTSPEGLLRLIASGEGQHVEFKTRLPPDRAIAQTLTAFANATGGVLLIGVTDDGSIHGLIPDEAQVAFRRVESICKSFADIPTSWGIRTVEDKFVVFAAVAEAPKELRPIGISDGSVYFRREATNSADAEALTLMLRESFESLAEGVVPIHRGRINVFVAMSFRNEEEPHLEDYFNAMRRAASRVKEIELRRIDLVEGDYEISQQIMDEIDKADAVVADFTLSPRNVYFELGYARGKGKRIIQTARHGTALEFDARNWRTLFYRNATELEESLVKAFVALNSSAGMS